MKNRNEFEIAKQLMEEGYYLDAIKILKKQHKLEPHNGVIKFELARAWILSEISPERGEKFLNKIVNDKSHLSPLAMLELGRLEMCRNNRIKSRQFFEELIENYPKNKDYAIAEMIFLEIHEDNFKKAYEYYNKKQDSWNYKNSRQLETYLKMKLGLINNIDEIKNFYFYSQAMDYDREKALRHIELHLDENEEKQYHSVYNDSINIENLYEESKTKITSINPSFITIVDKYILDCDKPIGMINGEEVDCIKVVTLPNSDDILSMYPTYNPKTRVKK